MIVKERPEDFYVGEFLPLKYTSSGKYLYFLLWKKNMTTLAALQTLATKLHVPLKIIGFAGNKDKRAVTEQYISLSHVAKGKVLGLQLKDMVLTYVTHATERITLGALKGNFFKVVVRDLPKQKTLSISTVKNYFDTQRFGVEGKNYLIGKALLQGHFQEACHLLQLEVQDNDYVRALRTINKRLLLFYLHSYQSYLWNIVVSQIKKPPKTVPLLGYLTELKGVIKQTYMSLLEKEQVTQEAFLMQAMPELSCEGDVRAVFKQVKDFFYQEDKDELHKRKHKVTLTFTLDSGVYATMVIKQLFGKPL